MLVVEPDAVLPVEDVMLARALEDDADGNEQRGQHQDRKSREQNVKKAFNELVHGKKGKGKREKGKRLRG